MQTPSDPTGQEAHPEEDPNESLPPIFSSWKQLYAVVLGELGLLILLFHLFTQAFE